MSANSIKNIITILLMYFSINTIAQSIIVKPYIQNVDTSEVYIMWEIDNGDDAFLDWGETPFNLINSIPSSKVIGSGSSMIHTTLVSNLNTNSKYYYKVRTQSGTESSLYHFKTSKSKSSESEICLVAMSDMQRDGSYPNVFEELIEDGIIPTVDPSGTGEFSSLIDGILIPGDLVPTGGTYSQWKDYFFAKADSLFPYVPIYPVLGNHEYFGGGSGKDNFLKYFNLPTNGSANNLEEWWYKDISNVRVIGLNTNSDGIDQDTQLLWLQNVLDVACFDNTIDFVFCQFHHPYKSELWTPGESSFSGEIIEKLEDFSLDCNKPSIHFFGHTHGYSRGQSMNHQHLWVNVATAGGNIDSWGEYPNADYDEFTKSQDEYGFVKLNVEAGPDPRFELYRYSWGDEFTPLNNVLRDEIVIKRYDSIPAQAITLFPFDEEVNPNCFELVGSSFYDVLGDTLQAAHWQISADSTNFENNLIYESWKQSENWYNEINTQANDNLENEEVTIGLDPNKEYYWRMRYRDQHLKWSDWSSFAIFQTGESTILSSNLVDNAGAELGIQDWTGDIEDLISNECGSVPVYAGVKMFAVGGVCQNESAYGQAIQSVSVIPYEMDILEGDVYADYSAFMRNFSGSDVPSMYLEFVDDLGTVISTSQTVMNAESNWIEKSNLELVPSNTKTINIILEGTRNAGTDNDSYFDEISLILTKSQDCSYFDPCPNIKVVDNLVYDKNHVVTALDTIISSSHILGNSNLEYKSSDVIALDIDFHIEKTSNLEINIDNCN